MPALKSPKDLFRNMKKKKGTSGANEPSSSDKSSGKTKQTSSRNNDPASSLDSAKNKDNLGDVSGHSKNLLKPSGPGSQMSLPSHTSPFSSPVPSLPASPTSQERHRVAPEGIRLRSEDSLESTVSSETSKAILPSGRDAAGDVMFPMDAERINRILAGGAYSSAEELERLKKQGKVNIPKVKTTSRSSLRQPAKKSVSRPVISRPIIPPMENEFQNWNSSTGSFTAPIHITPVMKDAMDNAATVRTGKHLFTTEDLQGLVAMRMTLTRVYLDMKIRTDLKQDLNLPVFAVGDRSLVHNLNRRNLEVSLFPGQPINEIDKEIRSTPLCCRYDEWVDKNGRESLQHLALSDVAELDDVGMNVIFTGYNDWVRGLKAGMDEDSASDFTDFEV